MIVWTYVMTVDDGGAPNWQLPKTTLAICKPEIRRQATNGELVLAFNGQRLSSEPHSVRWAGLVEEVIPFSAYWTDARFQEKKPDRAVGMPDNIYKPTPTGLRQVPNPKHGPRAAKSDTRGLNVLIFQRVWRCIPGQVLPLDFGLRMSPGRRGHRRHELTDVKWRELERWLDRAADT
jgi:hypothetical protein